MLLFCLAIEAADGFGLFSTDTITVNKQSQQIAKLQLETAKATREAASFAADAQRLKLELQEEEHKRASRQVSDEQLSALAVDLSKIGGPYFLVCRDEDEPRRYCTRFELALDKAHLTDPGNENVAFVISPADNWTGITLY